MYQKAVQSIYQEERNAGNAYRAEYCKSISALIADKKEEARQERDLYAGEIAQNREACREKDYRRGFIGDGKAAGTIRGISRRVLVLQVCDNRR